jgi:YVTN family beta-propeller protein
MHVRCIGVSTFCALLAACTGQGGTGGAGRAAAAATVPRSGVPAAAFSNYESAHVHPLDMTPDGKRLLAVNTANGTLEIFDVSGATTVSLASVVKVGLDPVTVRAASNTEAWVVNVLSDTVSVVDLASATVKATLATDDEPADVVFAGAPRRAYVSCAQAKTVLVFDPAQPAQPPSRIAILGEQPRALATSPDGSKVYLAIFESGNGTTILSGKSSNAEPDVLHDPSGPYGGVNPPPNANGGTTFNPPQNPANPAPPPGLSLIVRRTATGDWVDDNGRSWRRFVSGGVNADWGARVRTAGWDLVDRDVATIDTATGAVTYQGGMLNIVMNVAVNPATGLVTVIGTDATNEVRFEPILNGRFLRVLAGGFMPGGTPATCDLNSHLTYATPSVPVSERTRSIGDPRGLAFNAAGTRTYVTGMGSNNLVVFDASCRRVGQAPTIAVGQGPTAIVLQEAQRRAFVLNRFDATISVVSLDTETVTATVPFSYDPTPQVVKDGRPLLFNTHLLSGLGQISCASCHVDGKSDRLAWDRGIPNGEMVSVVDGTGKTVQHHPMKGPFLTQNLVDTMQSYLLHWRGDKPTLGHFSSSFQTLLGADAAATPEQVATLQAFLETLRTPPNPYRNLDNSYPTSLSIPGPRGTIARVGNAVLGLAEFQQSCQGCHRGHTGRGWVLLDRPQFGGGNYLLPARWQHFYRRTGLWFGDATASTAGFGFQPDGTYDSTHNQTRSDNLMAFMFAFDGSFLSTPAGLDRYTVAVDSHAAVGKQAVISGAGVADARLGQLMDLAETRAIGLVASACIAGERRGYTYLGSGGFQSDRAGETATLASLTSAAVANGPITFTAVRSGTETRIGIDEDLDGVLDGDAGPTPARACTSSATPVSVTASLTQPQAGVRMISSSVVTLAASATATAGSIARVSYYDGSTLLGSATASPYAVTWSNPSVGTHTLTAVATDGSGATGTSAALTLAVVASNGSPPAGATSCSSENGTCTLPAGRVADVWYGAGTTWNVKTGASGSVSCSNAVYGDPLYGTRKGCSYVLPGLPPTVSLTQPLAGVRMISSSTVTLAASAAATSGASIARVSYYDGATLLGSATAPPYAVGWSNPSVGTHAVTAVATDGNGLTGTSAALTLVVVASNGNPPAGATWCSGENATCTVPAGTVADVWYGAGARWNVKTGVSGSISCSNAVFGDPLWGTGKSCSSVVAGVPPDTNLLVNGSFETNTVGAGGWAQVSSLPGWQGSAGAIEVWRNLNGWAAADGQSWIELDAASGLDRVSQAVTTTAGSSLTLSFACSARPGTSAQSNRFDVIWNGTVLETVSPEGNGLSAPAWQIRSYTVTATGNDTVTFAESGTNDGLGGLIDAVSLVRR